MKILFDMETIPGSCKPVQFPQSQDAISHGFAIGDPPHDRRQSSLGASARAVGHSRQPLCPRDGQRDSIPLLIVIILERTHRWCHEVGDGFAQETLDKSPRS